MKKLLTTLTLLAITVWAYAERSKFAYIGNDYDGITHSQVASQIGRTETEITLHISDSSKRVVVIFENATPQEESNLDALMVTTKGLTKQ